MCGGGASGGRVDRFQQYTQRLFPSNFRDRYMEQDGRQNLVTNLKTCDCHTGQLLFITYKTFSTMYCKIEDTVIMQLYIIIQAIIFKKT